MSAPIIPISIVDLPATAKVRTMGDKCDKRMPYTKTIFCVYMANHPGDCSWCPPQANERQLRALDRRETTWAPRCPERHPADVGQQCTREPSHEGPHNYAHAPRPLAPIPPPESPAAPPPSALGPYESIGVEIGALVQAKQKAYGDSFTKAADVLAILYPAGIPLAQLGDALTIVRVVDKIFRIATDRDALGESPWDDVAGYALLSAKRVRDARGA